MYISLYNEYLTLYHNYYADGTNVGNREVTLSIKAWKPSSKVDGRKWIEGESLLKIRLHIRSLFKMCDHLQIIYVNKNILLKMSIHISDQMVSIAAWIRCLFVQVTLWSTLLSASPVTTLVVSVLSCIKWRNQLAFGYTRKDLFREGIDYSLIFFLRFFLREAN